MAKAYDYEAIVAALLYAQGQWRKNGRVERKTYLRLRCLMSQKVINRMTGQLVDYHNPMSTMKAVQDLFELPEWRKAWAWASKAQNEALASKAKLIRCGCVSLDNPEDANFIRERCGLLPIEAHQ